MGNSRPIERPPLVAKWSSTSGSHRDAWARSRCAGSGTDEQARRRDSTAYLLLAAMVIERVALPLW